MFNKIGVVIKRTSQRRGDDVVGALAVRQSGREVISAACRDIPNEMVSKIKVKTFKRGVLSVVAPRLLCVELQMRAEGLREDINKSIGKAIVKDLRFRSS